MVDWPPHGNNDLVTDSCGVCGAIVGIAYGNLGTPTDNRDKHVEWHRRLMVMITRESMDSNAD